ncbi:MAG TPA: winged helix-turn-helix domain-containing protein [Sphingobium sp.]
MRLLIVEDDGEFAGTLAEALAFRDIASEVANCAGDADILLNTTSFVAIILDLSRPEIDGLGLIRSWRAQGHREPIIVLSGREGATACIAALHAGADDFVLKPFVFAELHARLEAVVRRYDGHSDPVIRAGPISFDMLTRQVCIDDTPIHLSVRETDIVEVLIRRGNHVISRRMLEDQLFGTSDELGSNAVEVYIHRLRRKIEDKAGVSIRTIRGIGYMLVAH